MTVASNVVYMNRNEVTLYPGRSNSSSNVSDLVSKTSLISAWDVSDERWDEFMSCSRTIWSPFRVTVTDVDPGAAPHIEAHIGGTPVQAGLPSNFVGVSPFASCHPIERSVVLVFADHYNSPAILCEITAQEVAHSYGLDHEMLAGDVMTYLGSSGYRSFVDQDAPCGEYEARECGFGCGRFTQNSYQALADLLGKNTNHGGSDVAIDELPHPSPADDLGCSAGSPSLAMALVIAWLVRR